MTTTQELLDHAVDSVRDVTRRLHDLGASRPQGPRALDAHLTTLDTRESGTLACYAAGEGDAPPMLLLHSVNAAASAFEMEPLFEHYRATRRVYALDLPGFGASSRERVDYTPERYARAVERVLIDVVNAEKTPAVVVSLSLASEFAARAALSSPSLVRALVHISPTGLGRAELAPGRLASLRRAVFKNDLVTRAIFPLLTARPSVRYFLRRTFGAKVPEGLVDHAVATARVEGARFAPSDFLAGSLFTPDARGALYERVTSPQLVVHGVDPFTDYGDLPRLVANNPRVSVEVMPTGAMPHWESVDRVVGAIDGFESRGAKQD